MHPYVIYCTIVGVCNYQRYGRGGGQETKNALCVLSLNMINDKVSFYHGCIFSQTYEIKCSMKCLFANSFDCLKVISLSICPQMVIFYIAGFCHPLVLALLTPTSRDKQVIPVSLVQKPYGDGATFVERGP